MKNFELPSPAHPLKKILRSHRVSQAAVARYLGISHQRLFRFLNGYQPMPEYIERQLTTILIEKRLGHP